MIVCNVDRFLAEAIDSVLGQTFRDFEFIILDFGSTDNSKVIVSRYAVSDSRIKFREIPHCGLAEARNAACSLAQGRYIAIMDADDVSLPGRLAREVDFMEAHPEVGVVGGAVEWIDATGRPLRKMPRPIGDRDIRSALLRYSPLWQPSVLMRRNAFVLAGGYRAPFAAAEDYDLWLRIAERFQIANLEEVVLRYRIHPYQVSLRKRRAQTMCSLAAQTAATSRRNGTPDPFVGVGEMTSTLLAELGVTEAEQEIAFASDSTWWIRSVLAAGQDELALQSALEMLSYDWRYPERRQLSDTHLIVARLYWRQRKFLKSLFAATQAVTARPVVAGRPLKLLLRWLRTRKVAQAGSQLDSQVQR
jgi:glycosyltransferase involved in cell wall biosynthesis